MWKQERRLLLWGHWQDYFSNGVPREWTMRESEAPLLPKQGNVLFSLCVLWEEKKRRGLQAGTAVLYNPSLFWKLFWFHELHFVNQISNHPILWKFQAISSGTICTCSIWFSNTKYMSKLKYTITFPQWSMTAGDLCPLPIWNLLLGPCLQVGNSIPALQDWICPPLNGDTAVLRSGGKLGLLDIKLEWERGL